MTSVVQVWIQTGAADPGHEITPQPVGTGLLAPGGSFLSGSDTHLVELYKHLEWTVILDLCLSLP